MSGVSTRYASYIRLAIVLKRHLRVSELANHIMRSVAG